MAVYLRHCSHWEFNGFAPYRFEERVDAQGRVRRFVSEGTSHRLGDARQSIREVGAAPGSDLDALALLQGDDAIAVVLHFEEPAGPVLLRRRARASLTAGRALQ